MDGIGLSGRPRLPWIDIMKVMGLFFIIYGHMFSYGYQYVYAFNVPVFFVISGFLFKEDQPASEFWSKLWRQLVIPMLAICLINNAYLLVNDLIHHRLETSRLLFPVGILAGQQHYLDVCWFIYTLVLLKLISRFVRGNLFRILLAVAFLVVAFFVAPVIQSHDWRNAILCVLLSYPFFLSGSLAKASGFPVKPLSWVACLIGTVISGAVLFFVTRFNGDVFLYRFIYGNSILLYLLGGAAGTALLFFVSKLFDKSSVWVKTLALGSVVVLGFHRYLIILYRHFFDKNPFDILVALAILLLFIPVVCFCIRHIPWLVGNRS